MAFAHPFLEIATQEKPLAMVLYPANQDAMERYRVWLQELLDIEVEICLDMAENMLITTPVLLLYQSPAVFLAQALASGVKSEQVLETWKEQAQIALNAIRRNRRRITVLELDAVTVDPVGTLERCGIPLRHPPAATNPPVLAPEPLLHLLGAELLRRDHKAASLAAELEASSFVGGYGADLPDLNLINQTRLSERARVQEGLNERDALIRQIQELRESHEAVLAQFRSQQDNDLRERDSLVLQIQEQRESHEAAVARLLRQQDKSQSERNALDHLIQDLRTEQDVTLAQLLHQQEEAIREQEETRRLNERLEQLRQGLESSEAQLKIREDRIAELTRTLAERSMLAQRLDADLHRRIGEMNAQAEKDTGAWILVGETRAELTAVRDQFEKCEAELSRIRKARSSRFSEMLRHFKAVMWPRKTAL